MAKFFFNAKGVDQNGNPEWSDEKDGWVTLEARDWAGAIAQLPQVTQDLIKQEMKKERVKTFSKLLENTAGWGLPFTLYSQEDYDSITDNLL